MKKVFKNQSAFTLVEVMVSAAILGIIIVGLAQLFVYSSTLAELSGNMMTATNEVQSKMDEIRNTSFSSISTTYPSGTIFDLSQVTGKGSIYLDTTDANLYQVKIVACWSNKYGRIIGEDTDLDGALDVGEDIAGGTSGELDSVVTLISYVGRK